MSDEGFPPDLLARHPELELVQEALTAHREGRPVTVRCPRCGGQLTVQEIPETGTLLVACANGHVLFRAKREPTA
jgi:hypothetical protein